MELLEFKNKIFEMLGVSEVKDIGEKLLNAAMSHNTEIFDKYSEIADNSKDMLQALWQYYEADRVGKKQDYTPKSLCRLVSALAGGCRNVYDCCGGSGALSIDIINTHNPEKVVIEELDERVIPFLIFNLCFHNADGYVINGDVLTGDVGCIYKIKHGEKYSDCDMIKYTDEINNIKFDTAISNPPYNIKWSLPSTNTNDPRFPVVPPFGNANYAFVMHCLAKSRGKVIMILPNGIMQSNNELQVRKYLVDNDFIESVIALPDKMFEVTAIATCILVLNKNKKHKGKVIFIDSRQNYIEEERLQNGQFGGNSHTGRTYNKIYKVLSDENINKIINTIDTAEETAEYSAICDNKEISDNEYKLAPSRYIKLEYHEPKHRNIQEIADNINYITRMRSACKIIINETLARKLGVDIENRKEDIESGKKCRSQMKAIGFDLRADDYITFTKNKNEFVFKCNDPEIVPAIFFEILKIWSVQDKTLKDMQTAFLEELRDALIPELMSGKIDVSGVDLSIFGDET